MLFLQAIERHAVLAREVVHAGELAFQRVELHRFGVEVVAHLAEQGQGLLDLDRRAVQQRVHVAQARFVFRLPGEIGPDLLQLPRQRGRVVAGELPQRRIAGLDQAARMRLPAVAGHQRLKRGRSEVLAL